tara:strand:+ start:12948 stop:13292 length:345 start_codon:yes stop_codon:yes gene_type:complete
MFFNRILFCFILYFTGTFTNANAVQPISVLLPDNILSHLLNRGFRIGFNISCTDLSSTLSECNNIGVFLPQCNKDGGFLQKQCHSSTGFCWCSDVNGKRLSEPVRAWKVLECSS